MKQVWKFPIWVKMFLGILVLLLIFIFVSVFLLDKNPHSTSTYRNWLRLRSVYTMLGGLENYYNQNKKYPNELNELVPAYFDQATLNLPQLKIKNPACSLTEPFGYYTKNNNQSYVITFCLPERDSQYTAGYHIATPEGIK